MLDVKAVERGDGVVDQSLAPLAAASLIGATIGLMRVRAERAERPVVEHKPPRIYSEPSPPRVPNHQGPILGRAVASRRTRPGERTQWHFRESHIAHLRPADECAGCGELCTLLLSNWWRMYNDYDFWSELSCVWCDAASPLPLLAAWDTDHWVLSLEGTHRHYGQRRAYDVAAEQLIAALARHRPDLAPPAYDVARALWTTHGESTMPGQAPEGRAAALAQLLAP